eukprot:COSAG02_NODE_4178_length_5658_cov_2.011693_2_plen_992_part_00
MEPEPEPEPEPELMVEVPAEVSAGVGLQESSERGAPPSPMLAPVSPASPGFSLSSPREPQRAVAPESSGGGPVEYRALKVTDVYEEPDINSPKITDLGQGEVFLVLRQETTKKASTGMDVRFVEITHSTLTLRGFETGWVQLTTSRGEPLCAKESAVQTLLSSVPLLQQLSEQDRKSIANVLEAASYVEDQAIIDLGATGEGCKHMYFVESGTACASIGHDVVREYRRNDFFGELALLTDEPRKATVKAGTSGCRCLKLARDAFNAFASDCVEILDQRRKQYAMVHVIDVSEPALRSYLERPDLRDKRPDSREFAPWPSIGALKLLCRVIANAPARVKTSDAALGHQHLQRRITADGHAEDLLENDVAMVAKMLAPALNRMETTYLGPKNRAEQRDDEEKERARLLAAQPRSAAVVKFSDKTANSDGSETYVAGVSAPATPTKNSSRGDATPGNRSARGTPSGNTASMASEAVPKVDPKAQVDGDGKSKFALNRSQRDQIRDFMAIARDVQLMMEKYGFSDEDVLQPFHDPSFVFGRKLGNWRVPFLHSLRIEQSDVDRLLVVVSHRLRPRGGRSYEDEQKLTGLIASVEADEATLRTFRRDGKETTKDPLKRLKSTYEKNTKAIEKLREVSPFGHAPAFHNPLTDYEGHALATMCESPRFRGMLMNETYDLKRAVGVVDTLLEGLLLDPKQPRKLHNQQNFEEVAPKVQQDFIACFKQVSLDVSCRRKLLEDDRVVKSLCMVAVAGRSLDAQRDAKAALEALKPTTPDEQKTWYAMFEEAATNGRWPEGTEEGKKHAEQLAADLKTEFEHAMAEVSRLPEGDPSTAAATPGSLVKPATPDGASQIMAQKMERAAQKLRVKDGKDSWRVLSGKKSPAVVSKKAVKSAAGIAAETVQAMTAHKDLRQKREHREAEDLSDFFEAAITPFRKLFIATDDFAKEVTGQWATVVFRDMFQMKICAKVLIKAYDPKSNLFLVRTHTSCPLCCIRLRR